MENEYDAVLGAVNWYQRSGDAAMVVIPPTVVPVTVDDEPEHVIVPALGTDESLVGHVAVSLYAPLLVLNPSTTTT